MKRRVSPGCLLLVAAFVSTCAIARAQNTLTDTAQLADAFNRTDALYLPFAPSQWEALPTEGEFSWADFSQLPEGFSTHWPTSPPQVYGVNLLPVRLTKDVLTGEVLVESESGEELARLAVPADYQPGKQWPDAAVLQMWKEFAASWDESYGKLEPPMLVLHVRLADIKDKETYDENLAAEEATWLEAQAKATEAQEEQSGSGGMMLMEGGDPCTNEGIAVTSIVADTNGWITVTWESCLTNYVYGVLSSDELSTNTLWVGQAAMWGEDGTTSWTDTNSVSIDHRFYKVVRTPPDGDFDGDGLSNADELDVYGTDPLNPSTAGDGYSDGWKVQYGFDPRYALPSGCRPKYW